MDRPETPSPLGFLLMGLCGVIYALCALGAQRWAILLGIFFGIALCHWMPWLCGLDLRPPE